MRVEASTRLLHKAKSLLCVIWTMLWPAATFACENLAFAEAVPATTGPDGHFFAQSTSSFVEGRPVVAISNDRVGQRLRMAQDCVGTEQLLFADCSTGEIVVIDGTISPEQSRMQRAEPTTIFFFDTNARYLQPPYGPIGLTPTSSVRKIARSADQAGFRNFLSAAGAFAGYAVGAGFDPFFGCKLFYPDSLGAQE